MPPFPTTPLTRLTTPSNSPIHALTFSSGSGQYLLTGSSDRSIRLYNPNTSRIIQTYSAHGYEVLDLAVSRDNARFVSVGGDKTVFLWDVESGVSVRRFTGHTGRVEGCAFGGEGGEGSGESVVVTGGRDGTVRVWDVRAKGKEVMVLREAGDAVSSVVVGDGIILAGSVDGRVRCYDLAAGKAEVDCLGASVVSLSLGGDGESYLAGTLGGKLRLMDRRSGGCLQTFRDDDFKNEEYRVRSTLAQVDGVAVCGGEDGRVVVWDVLSGEVRERLWHTEKGERGDGGKRGVVSAVAWNGVREQWASAGGDGTVVVWGAGE
ncbi:uncharacterized protein LTR77_009809 [Saxophila tyrrhenica]|uniref:Mitogen-activated protein kinase organizer 1 n=1 Tax=Saxophila tyrrhenica TaxID=1690608 RepID=A0AAV9P158_9PEZI|nr:hypothetical protein LTR77_009809 [Saxophila tyrrhenica]